MTGFLVAVAQTESTVVLEMTRSLGVATLISSWVALAVI